MKKILNIVLFVRFIMNLIKNELHKYSDVKTIWFNTWQFSQFNMDDQLAISLLSNLIAEFEITDGKALEDTNKIIKGLRIATSIGKNLMYAYVEAGGICKRSSPKERGSSYRKFRIS